MLPEIYVTVPSYALWATIGLSVAVLFIFIRMETIQLTFFDLLQYMFVSAISGFVLARVVFVIVMIFIMQPVTIENVVYYIFNGGIVFYGGLFGVILGICIVSRLKKSDAMLNLDFFASAFPLFHSFARIGCLFAGCCYGIEWKWGVIMLNEEGIVRFPVQIFESLCNVFIFCFMIFNARKNGIKGQLKIYLCSYAVCRFVLEFFRGDAVRGIWFGLSTAQYISIGIISVYVLKNLRKRCNYKHESRKVGCEIEFE